MSRTTIVTAAPPTPNGDLHLGHLSGPYLGADVFTRARRLHGGAAVYATGSDVNQSYVPAKARAIGCDALVMAQQFADEIASIFAQARFDVDSYVRPQHTPAHTRAVRAFVSQLWRDDRLEARTDECLYCEVCDRYLFEAYVSGKCPHCGGRSDGNSCEHCAWPNSCVDLVDPVCTTCGAQPSSRAYRRLVFPLGRYAERLARYHADAVMSPQLEALCAELMRHGLPDIPITHPTDWGIPVPVEGFEDQCVYVWAEMVPGYLVAAARAAGQDDGSDLAGLALWNDPATDVVQFFGFDNGYFHALLFPALLMAHDAGNTLPRAMLTNEFYLLSREKFSTSRRHAIWAVDLLSKVPPDIVRFVVAHDRPEQEQTDFTWARFRSLVEGELVGRWQHWLDGLFCRLEAMRGSRAPSVAAATRSQREYLSMVEADARACLRAYSAEAFSTRRAAESLSRIVTEARRFAASQGRLLATSPDCDEASAALGAELATARTLSLLAYPLMPGFAEGLWRALGGDGPMVWDGVRPVPPGTPVANRFRFFDPLPSDLESVS